MPLTHAFQSFFSDLSARNVLIHKEYPDRSGLKAISVNISDLGESVHVAGQVTARFPYSTKREGIALESSPKHQVEDLLRNEVHMLGDLFAMMVRKQWEAQSPRYIDRRIPKCVYECFRLCKEFAKPRFGGFFDTDGRDFDLMQREPQVILSQFQDIFREFEWDGSTDAGFDWQPQDEEVVELTPEWISEILKDTESSSSLFSPSNTQ